MALMKNLGICKFFSSKCPKRINFHRFLAHFPLLLGIYEKILFKHPNSKNILGILVQKILPMPQIHFFHFNKTTACAKKC